MSPTWSSDETPVLVHGRDDARLLLCNPPPSRHVVALSPAARAELAAAGVSAIPSTALYSDHGHARTSIRCMRIRDRAQAALASSDVAPAARELLLWRITLAAGAAAGLWQVISRAPAWWYRREDGWDRYTDSAALHRHLLSTAARPRAGIQPMPHRLRYIAWLANVLARASLPRGRSMVLSQAVLYGMDALADTLADADKDLCVIAPAPRGGLLPSIRRNLANLLRHRRARLLRFLPCTTADPDQMRAARALIDSAATADAVAGRGLSAWRETMALEAAETAGLATALAQIVGDGRLRAAITWDACTSEGVAIAHAAASLGAACFVVGHATVAAHSRPREAPLRRICNRAMIAGQTATITLAQSPAVARAAAQLRGEQAIVPAPPFLWVRGGARQAAERAPDADEPLFVWAGNYHSWSHHLPWVSETAEEMVEGLVRLCEAVNRTPGIRLEISAKSAWANKLDCDEQALRQLLPLGERCTVNTAGRLADSLTRATCLVSHSSTAIEEALLARRPVLLWGGRTRGAFLPGATTPPTPGSRAAVYAPGWSDDLSAWLGAIAAAHRGTLLSPDELDGWIWPEGTTTLRAVAQRILAGKGAAPSAQSVPAGVPA